MAHPRYTSDEIARRGQGLYDQQIRAEVEADNRGKFLVLDIETGEYEIDEDERVALKRIQTKNPGAALYMLRSGYAAAYRLGGQLRVGNP
jgi:hypothetical protein